MRISLNKNMSIYSKASKEVSLGKIFCFSMRDIFLIIIIAIMLSAFLCGTASATSVNSATGKINHKGTLNLRAKANSDEKTKIVAKLKNNTDITIKKEVFTSKTSTSKSDIWYYIEANGKKGYIKSNHVDNIEYKPVFAWIKEKTNYRKGAGTEMSLLGTFKADDVVKVFLKATPVKSTRGSSSTWYKVKVGSNYYYTVSTGIKLMPTDNIYQNMTDDEFNKYLKEQGFNASYRSELKKLHEKHPNWEFKGKKMGLNFDDAVSAQRNPTKISKIEKKVSGKWKWVDASKKEVSYYLDPRNFMDQKYVFMFETHEYNPNYQTESVVNKILKGTYLEKYKFKATYFVKYGKKYNISPVHLASRARQETGGANCVQINGTKYPFDKKDSAGDDNRKVVYNPFNIGGNTGSTDAMKYAYDHNWTTKGKSVKGAAKLLAESYVTTGQNTGYFEKFNFVNGKASHQYMSNIKAPYSEASTAYNSYKDIGVINEAFSFVIPIYTDMPDKTEL